MCFADENSKPISGGASKVQPTKRSTPLRRRVYTCKVMLEKQPDTNTTEVRKNFKVKVNRNCGCKFTWTLSNCSSLLDVFIRLFADKVATYFICFTKLKLSKWYPISSLSNLYPVTQSHFVKSRSGESSPKLIVLRFHCIPLSPASQTHDHDQINEFTQRQQTTA